MNLGLPCIISYHILFMTTIKIITLKYCYGMKLTNQLTFNFSGMNDVNDVLFWFISSHWSWTGGVPWLYRKRNAKEITSSMEESSRVSLVLYCWINCFTTTLYVHPIQRNHNSYRKVLFDSDLESLLPTSQKEKLITTCQSDLMLPN